MIATHSRPNPNRTPLSFPSNNRSAPAWVKFWGQSWLPICLYFGGRIGVKLGQFWVQFGAALGSQFWLNFWAIFFVVLAAALCDTRPAAIKVVPTIFEHYGGHTVSTGQAPGSSPRVPLTPRRIRGLLSPKGGGCTYGNPWSRMRECCRAYGITDLRAAV